MIDAIGVVVPAHDEQDSIAACVEALERARHELPSKIETHVVLVLDACSDRTGAIARRCLKGSHSCVEVACCNVGRARHQGVAALLQHFARWNTSRIWLASTDADSQVPVTWFQEQLTIAARGYDAVAGVVRVEDWQAHGYGARHVTAYDAFYAQHAGTDSHGHVHGANLGVRASAYEAVGGFPALVTGEDHALWNALRAAGHRTFATRRIEVVTSARVQARAPRGFASFLAELNAPGE